MLGYQDYHLLNKIFVRSSLLLFLTIGLMLSCSSTEEQPDERFLEKELYDTTQIRLKNGNFSNAIASLESLERRFPFGRYAEQAQAELIYAYYKNFEFEAARSAAERFVNLHPRHPHAGYAYYLRGLSGFTEDSGLFTRYFESNLSKRDIEPAEQSFEDLSEFLARFPDSTYAANAKQRMIYLKNILAEHEIIVANFYMERKAYVAALGRAKYVLEHLPNTPQVPEALSILIKAYGRLGYEDLRQKSYEILKVSYPDYDAEAVIRPKRSWVSRLSFGLLGDEEIPPPPRVD
ncbi:MAG TPA: outer membrane protein assembly factor BamD [Gammaproteobacteria bacterium]|nr:outer membrane protein assembly factor BamD [Gammaproteobacteria bacterium]